MDMTLLPENSLLVHMNTQTHLYDSYKGSYPLETLPWMILVESSHAGILRPQIKNTEPLKMYERIESCNFNNQRTSFRESERKPRERQIVPLDHLGSKTFCPSVCFFEFYFNLYLAYNYNYLMRQCFFLLLLFYKTKRYN